jgi:predicted dinucleotide-binding enzyme
MKIAIIGAGNVGKALAASAGRAGHRVVISAAHPEHASDAAQETGATAAASPGEAIRNADVVVLAVPAAAHPYLATDLAGELAGRTVVDVSNRPTPDPSGAPTSVAEELQARLPNAKVVKAFNTAFASRQAQPRMGNLRADGFVAADDEGAKRKVLRLVESIGFRPIDAGPLAAARTLEGMAWLNINRNMQGGSWQDAWVIAEAA